jgi:hypothetical protein
MSYKTNYISFASLKNVIILCTVKDWFNSSESRNLRAIESRKKHFVDNSWYSKNLVTLCNVEQITKGYNG